MAVRREGTVVQHAQFIFSLERFLAVQPYYPCCILAHSDLRQLHEAAAIIREHYDWPVLSLGAVLSEALRDVVPHQRAQTTHAVLCAALSPVAPGPLLCGEIDLLFEPSLQLDPLRLLREVSRSATIIVLWPGTSLAGTLAYAVPAHHHYRTWRSTDLMAECVVSL